MCRLYATHMKPENTPHIVQQKKWRIPKACWRVLGALGGGTMVFLCILFSLGIWISYYDNDGGEPGSETIFGSIPYWPLFGFLILVGMLACSVSRRLFAALLVLTLALFIWSFTLTQINRAENRRQWKEQQDAARQELMLEPTPWTSSTASSNTTHGRPAV